MKEGFITVKPILLSCRFEGTSVGDIMIVTDLSSVKEFRGYIETDPDQKEGTLPRSCTRVLSSAEARTTWRKRYDSLDKAKIALAAAM
eukprot:COSAG05_NODE_14979_length_381_cov_1.386525_1_plen_87_part_01